MTTKFEVGDEVLIRGVLIENQDSNYYPFNLRMKDGNVLDSFSKEGCFCQGNGKQVLELVKRAKLPFGQVRRSKDLYCTAFVLEDDGETIFYRYKFEGEKDWYALQKDKNYFLEFYSEIVDQKK